MKKMRWIISLLGLVFMLASRLDAEEVRSEAPQAVSLSLYDAGLGLVTDQRRLVLARGENLIRFEGVPATLDPASAYCVVVGAMDSLIVLDHQFEDDLAFPERLFQRYVGQDISVRQAGETRTGRLLSAPVLPAQRAISLLESGGAAWLFPELSELQEVQFPRAREQAFIRPALRVRAQASQDGPCTVRLNYMTEGLAWAVSYEAIQAGDGGAVQLSIRAGLENRSGVAFKEARVRLIATEKGSEVPSAPAGARAGEPALRHAYGREEPSSERAVASATALQTYDLPGTFTLEDGATLYVQLAQVAKLPVQQFFVYDGVRFDRFQRNRRTDWNYGTEHHKTVQTYLQFSNTVAEGLGFALPPGLLRLYRQTESGALDLAGQERLPAVSVGGGVSVQLGPAKDLSGERERTGYSEVVPLKEYEESFEIRLENSSPGSVEIRVVEHLYRWSDYEIVKADAEYVRTAPQTIEFRPVLKPGGKRTLRYTVRYRW